MSKWTMFLCSLAVLVIAVGLSGCGGDDQATELSPEEATIQKALAGLPEADRGAAEKQRICPVSEARLGSMGTPIRVTVKDGEGQEHDVFLCCDGCKEAVQQEPDTYLAKLSN